MTASPPGEDGTLVGGREILDEAGIARTLRRIAHEIVEAHPDGAFALVGIRTGGLFLAERLRRLIVATEGWPEARVLPLGAVDIALYRDDVAGGRPRPEIGPTELPFSLPGRTVVLVDDVLYTGRTIRGALDALMDYGRPRAVELAVLVDRGHRELPIQADYVGVRAETTRTELVKVELAEKGLRDRVVVRARPGALP